MGFSRRCGVDWLQRKHQKPRPHLVDGAYSRASSRFGRPCSIYRKIRFTRSAKCSQNHPKAGFLAHG